MVATRSAFSVKSKQASGRASESDRQRQLILSALRNLASFRLSSRQHPICSRNLSVFISDTYRLCSFT